MAAQLAEGQERIERSMLVRNFPDWSGETQSELLEEMLRLIYEVTPPEELWGLPPQVAAQHLRGWICEVRRIGKPGDRSRLVLVVFRGVREKAMVKTRSHLLSGNQPTNRIRFENDLPQEVRDKRRRS